MLTKKDTEVRLCTIIGRGTEFNGDFTVQGSARIDGMVFGKVTVSGTLIIGAGGRIEGDVYAQSAIIGGELLGDVNAPDKVELTSEARVIGDITTNNIVIDEHAVFQGRCDMNQTMPERKARPRISAKAKKSAKAALAEALKEMEAAQQVEAEEPEVSEASGNL
ncbi:MAG: polymer-forming cytoskeletal protein [Roseburia sp.]|nr:polymer-forming cytoskeletal protein [Roseburia sp.]